jgi:hypothetical protein
MWQLLQKSQLHNHWHQFINTYCDACNTGLQILQVTYVVENELTQEIYTVLTFFIYPFHGENLVLRKTADVPHFLTQLLHRDMRINVCNHNLPGTESQSTSVHLKLWLTQKFVSTTNYKYTICSQWHRLMAGRRNMNSPKPQKFQNYPILHSCWIYDHYSDNCRLQLRDNSFIPFTKPTQPSTHPALQQQWRWQTILVR